MKLVHWSLIGGLLPGTFGTAARRGLAGASVPVTVWYWYVVVCCCVVLKGLIGKARFNSRAYIFYCSVRLNEYSCNSFEYSFNPLCFLPSLFYTHCSGAVLYYCNFFSFYCCVYWTENYEYWVHSQMLLKFHLLLYLWHCAFGRSFYYKNLFSLAFTGSSAVHNKNKSASVSSGLKVLYKSVIIIIYYE